MTDILRELADRVDYRPPSAELLIHNIRERALRRHRLRIASGISGVGVLVSVAMLGLIDRAGPPSQLGASQAAVEQCEGLGRTEAQIEGPVSSIRAVYETTAARMVGWTARMRDVPPESPDNRFRSLNPNTPVTVCVFAGDFGVSPVDGSHSDTFYVVVHSGQAQPFMTARWDDVQDAPAP